MTRLNQPGDRRDPSFARRAAFLTVAAALLPAGVTLADDLPRALTDAQLRAAAPPPLSTIEVPEPPNLSEFVRNKKAAIALGKALYWEQRVGSQGQACASCHFQAGADPRSKNQLAPGLNGTDSFEPTNGGGLGGPNYQLTPADFPFHRKRDVTLSDRAPDNTLHDTNDVTSSMGPALADFLGVRRGYGGTYVAIEKEAPDPTFNVRGVNVRRVEPRNTPTVINAVYNHRNFWDGRANFIFNGVDPFGQRSNTALPDQGVWVKEYGRVVKKQVELPMASLASQAVGPPLSDFEMTSRGKTFPLIGRLLARHYALSLQSVHREDGVLASYRHPCRPGLTVTYEALIQYAFQPKYWATRYPICTPDGAFSQLELNFSLFFGLALQLYEATLTSPRSRFDDFVAGRDDALTPAEKFGFEVFVTTGRCTTCHTGPTFSDAVVPHVLGRENTPASLSIAFPVGPGLVIAADVGYLNIGVRPTTEDLGAGAPDPFGNPLTFAGQLASGRLADRFLGVTPGTPGSPVPPGAVVQARGGFKVPTLRNVEYTAPYMHNGGMLTLEQVVEFYARGGDFPATNGPDFTPIIAPIPALVGQPQRIAAVAAFLRSLTDPYVVDERAPFDHPSLVVPNGSRGDEVAASCREELLEIPAVGKRGRRAYRLPPIKKFLEGYAPLTTARR
jgi:cytochrome c peroxidase